jgi:hypothetical protein
MAKKAKFEIDGKITYDYRDPKIKNMLNDVIANMKKNKDIKGIATKSIFTTYGSINRNNRLYDSAYGVSNAKTFTNPLNLPVVTNHNGWDVDSTIGRVIHSEFTITDVKKNEGAIIGVFNVTDQDAIVKILDGRYLSLSPAFNGKYTCSICDKPGDAYGCDCEHIMGKIYDGKLAYRHYTTKQYGHLAVVVEPADLNASIREVENLSDLDSVNMFVGINEMTSSEYDSLQSIYKDNNYTSSTGGNDSIYVPIEYYFDTYTSNAIVIDGTKNKDSLKIISDDTLNTLMTTLDMDNSYNCNGIDVDTLTIVRELSSEYINKINNDINSLVLSDAIATGPFGVFPISTSDGVKLSISMVQDSKLENELKNNIINNILKLSIDHKIIEVPKQQEDNMPDLKTYEEKIDKLQDSVNNLSKSLSTIEAEKAKLATELDAKCKEAIELTEQLEAVTKSKDEMQDGLVKSHIMLSVMQKDNRTIEALSAMNNDVEKYAEQLSKQADSVISFLFKSSYDYAVKGGLFDQVIKEELANNGSAVSAEADKKAEDNKSKDGSDMSNFVADAAHETQIDSANASRLDPVSSAWTPVKK